MKVIVHFSSTAAAKRYVEKVKKLPYVTYATDYCRKTGSFHVMVCGEFTPEQAQMIKTKNI